MIVPKASKREKNAGLDELPEETAGIGDDRPSGQNYQRLDGRETRKMQNSHPTVKPIKLMSYLITLGSREGDIVLDPFCGSGTTCIAAALLKQSAAQQRREVAHTAARIPPGRLQPAYQARGTRFKDRGHIRASG